MTRPHRRSAFTAAAALAGGLVFAGCTAGPAPDESATTSPSTTPTPTPEATCIVGNWSTGAAQLQPAYDSIPAELEYPRAVIGPTASVTVAFAEDGTFALTQNVPTNLEWEGYPAAVGLGGGMDGTYTTAGENGIALLAETNALTVVPLDKRTSSALFAAATLETLAEWPVSASGYTCDDTTLTLELETEGFPAAIAFERA